MRQKSQYTYKRKVVKFLYAHVDGKCHKCKNIVETGDEAAFAPNGKVGDRYFHAKCVASDLKELNKK